LESEVSRNRGGGIGSITDFLQNVRNSGFIPRGIIDVGANRGDWTRLALSIFAADTPVIMIEPLDEMASYLTKRFAGCANCHYVQAGAGREAGKLVQTIWPDLNGSSFLPQVNSSQLRSGKQRKTTDRYHRFAPARYLPRLRS
jgi:FkbM family methyltransferase